MQWIRRMAWIPAMALVCVVASDHCVAGDGNRLTYLDEFNEPYHVGRGFPKLITPQWVGEEGVDAVVTLAIDDMRDPKRYEAFLRPILDRLKKIDGRAPVSIMTNTVDPRDPQLQQWLAEGLSLECHTIDHPCPILRDGDFAKAKSTYDRCVDLLASVPNNRPVAFRTPCCDSLNTPSPRLYAEIFNRTTPKGNYLQLDSSVFQIFTPNDPELPRELVLENGRERFRKYVPFKSFVNTIEDYPYPYVIGRMCWQFPCMVPSDWEAQHIQKPNNPMTVRDLKLALDATVVKKGTFNLVFHPHGWIRNDQIVEFIDHAVAKYGKRVKFLSFRECLERINASLLQRMSLRTGSGHGVKLLDLDNDGYLDIVIASHIATGGDFKQVQTTRRWLPRESRWIECDFPTPLAHVPKSGNDMPLGIRFGILRPDGQASLLSLSDRRRTGWYFEGQRWIENSRLADGLELDGKPIIADRDGIDQGVRLRDIDGDGICELLVSNPTQNAVFQRDVGNATWRKLSIGLPASAMFVDSQGNDAGLRFVDLDEDGRDDVVFSNDAGFGVYLFKSLDEGWSIKLRAGKRGNPGALPLISRGGTNNGMWVHSRSLWWQNEDTNKLPDLVDRRSFNELLGDAPPGPKSPDAALKTLRVRPGFTVELVAAEPLVMDPVAFDWGPDGKLYVVEMGDYPLGTDGRGKPGGRVRVLEDTDGDGKYDQSTLFLDKLNYANGIMSWRKGVLVCAAPDLLYAEDTDGDGKADVRRVLFTGFKEGNPQHRFNNPQWGLDNWVYLANGDSGGVVKSLQTGQSVDIRGRDVRLKPDEGLIEAESGQTQFGRNRDDWGNWFGCSNPYPIWHFVLPDHYLKRNPHVPPPDPRHFPPKQPMYTQVFPISRTLARFNDLHTANRITSACSTIIYRDDLFGPEFANNFFVCEPVHNLIHRQILKPQGPTFTSDRADDEQDREFLASSDNWFRPVMCRTGPDGALWIADMYRAVIEHPEWIPPHMQKNLDLRAGADRGRIYRVYPIGKRPRAMPRLDRMNPGELVAALDSPNGWVRDMAHCMLLWRGSPTNGRLDEHVRRGIATASTGARSWPLPSLVQALCVMDGLNELRPETVRLALGSPYPAVRRQAIRMAERLVAREPAIGEALVRMAEDTTAAALDGQVQLQLAFSLGASRGPAAGQALGKLLLRHHADEFIAAAAFSSIHQGNIDHVIAAVFAGSAQAGPTGDLIPRLLKLSAALGDENSLVGVLEVVTKSTNGRHETWQFAALAGVLDELDRRKESLEAIRQKTGKPSSEVISATQKMFATARKTVAGSWGHEPAAIVQVALLAREPEHLADDIRLFEDLLVTQKEHALQAAAVERMGKVNDPRVADAMLARWSGHSPALRRAILDALLRREAWIRTLLDHVARGVVAPADLDAARRQVILAHTNPTIRARAGKLLAAGTGADRAKVLAEYRSVTTMPGDEKRGAAVFEKRCATCHRLNNVGHAVGPDLAALTNRSPEALLIAILDPNRAVEEKYLNYSLRFIDGRTLTGIIQTETSGSVTLLAQDGKAEEVLRRDIDELRSSGKSMMPDGMEKDLSRQDLADVIALLAANAPPPKEFAGNKPEVVQPAADGTISLLATNCAIYGPAIMFEAQYKNLGHWSQPTDHAVWTVDVPRDAVYQVTLDYACPDNTAGNTFVVDAGESRLTAKVAATGGTWDDYGQADLGPLPLSAGRRTIVVRVEGTLRDHLFDLRGLKLTPRK